MLAQGPALLMMCYINSGEFERLLNVHSQRDEQRLVFKDGLLKASGLKSVAHRRRRRVKAHHGVILAGCEPRNTLRIRPVRPSRRGRS